MQRIAAAAAGAALILIPALAAGKGRPEFPPGQGVSLRVSTETAPTGAVAQIKVLLTEPKPIIKTKIALDGFDEADLEVLGISLYSPRGEAWGVARYAGGALTVEASSPTGDLGRSPDYPILTIAVRVKQATAGAMIPVNLDLAGSTFLDRLGVPYPAEVKQGGVVVGGTMAVNNVLPGGGRLEAAQVFQIEGKGFTNLTRVQIEGAERLAYEVKSDTLIELFTPAPFLLDGAEIRLRNTLDERVEYFSYMRPKVGGASTAALLNSLVPLLPPVDLASFTLPQVEPAGQTYFAVALENAGKDAAEVTLALHDTSGSATGSVMVAVPAYSRVVRSFAELFNNAAPGANSSLQVTSTQPVRGMGIRVNDATLGLTPVAPIY